MWREGGRCLGPRALRVLCVEGGPEVLYVWREGGRCLGRALVLYVWREGGRCLGPRALRYCMYGS